MISMRAHSKSGNFPSVNMKCYNGSNSNDKVGELNETSNAY